MSALHRFARHLADRAPRSEPLPLVEITTAVMPYRSCRRVLELESAEDYDLLLLRLLAEDAGLAVTFPPEVAERCRAEVDGPNPDLSLLERLEGATIRLNRDAIARAPRPEAERPAPAANARYELVFLETEAELPPPAAPPPHPPPPAATAAPTTPAGAGSAVEPREEPAVPVMASPEPAPTPPPLPLPVSEVEIADHLDIETEEEPAGKEGPGPSDVEAVARQEAAELEPDPLAGLLEEVEAPETPAAGPDPLAPRESGEVEELHPGAMDLPEPHETSPAPEPAPPAAEPAPRRFGDSDPVAAAGPHPPPPDSHIEPPMPVSSATSPGPTRCPSCAAILPQGRPVRFCPDCGRSVVATRCRRCAAELEPSWRHCVECGEPAGGDTRFA